MGDAPRFEDQVSGTANENLLAYPDADLTLEHECVLVPVTVGVDRSSEGSGLDGVLDERKVTPTLLPPIMNLTPSPPNCTLSPSSGESTTRGPAVMVGLLPLISSSNVGTNIVTGQKLVNPHSRRRCWISFSSSSRVIY